MYQRKRKPKKIETVLGIGILIILIGTGAVIFWEQYHFNPAVSALHWPGPAVVKSSSTSDALISKSLNMAPLTPAEVFESHNLSDKINGKADLYLSAGFRQLNSQRFKLDEDPESWLEIFVYDMESILNAFAVFSSQRRDDGKSSELAQFSYQTKNALFFVHGPYYVEIIASKSSEQLRAAMKSSAADFIRKHKVELETIGEIKIFPRQNLDENSITLIPANAFGYERLQQVFTAAYRLDNADLTVFISRCKSPQEAEQLALAYHDFLIAFGGKSLSNQTGITNARTVLIFETYELIFSQGSFLAGIHEAASRPAAERMADILNQRLKGSISE